VAIFDLIQRTSFITVKDDVCRTFYHYGIVLNVSEVNVKAGELCQITAHPFEILFYCFHSLLPRVTLARV